MAALIALLVQHGVLLVSLLANLFGDAVWVATGRPRGLVEHLETLDVTPDTAPRGILYG